MKVAVCYVFPNLRLSIYEPLARRFARTYQDFPPGEHPHSLHVLVTGSEPDERQQNLFGPLPVQMFQHNNYGKDIGAFMMASVNIPCDLLVCFGSHIHFHREGWLDRMVDVYLKIGPGLYGCWGFNTPSPHIRTTAFWIPPDILSSYPHKVCNESRYNFEHGARQSILRWVESMGLPVVAVGWNHVDIASKAGFSESKNNDRSQSLLCDQWTNIRNEREKG